MKLDKPWKIREVSWPFLYQYLPYRYWIYLITLTQPISRISQHKKKPHRHLPHETTWSSVIHNDMMWDSILYRYSLFWTRSCFWASSDSSWAFNLSMTSTFWGLGWLLTLACCWGEPDRSPSRAYWLALYLALPMYGLSPSPPLSSPSYRESGTLCPDIDISICAECTNTINKCFILVITQKHKKQILI